MLKNSCYLMEKNPNKKQASKWLALIIPFQNGVIIFCFLFLPSESLAKKRTKTPTTSCHGMSIKHPPDLK
jgi:hypothetical protein